MGDGRWAMGGFDLPQPDLRQSPPEFAPGGSMTLVSQSETYRRHTR